MAVQPSRSCVLAALAICAAGALGQTTKSSVAPPPASSADFAAALRDAKPGDVVRTSFSRLTPDVSPLALTFSPSTNAAKLAFSDRPEYFRGGDGIASQDEVQSGKRVRFYTYHVPVLTDGLPRRVLTVFENIGDSPATLKYSANSEPAPGGDYNLIAKSAAADLLNGKGEGVVTIAPHAHHLGECSAPIAKPDLLVHGIFEFTTDQPLRLTVAQVTATEKLEDDVAAIAALPKLPMLPYGNAKDKSGRGIFPCADFDVALKEPYDTATGPAKLLVADGKSDPWLEGVDGISGDKTTDKGNYGVLYHFKLKWKSTDGRGLAVLMTGGSYDPKSCGLVAAAVRVNDGRHPGGVIGLPRDAVRFHGVPEACVIQTFDPRADGGEATIELVYTPPGSCCLPTPILLVPIEK